MFSPDLDSIHKGKRWVLPFYPGAAGANSRRHSRDGRRVSDDKFLSTSATRRMRSRRSAPAWISTAIRMLSSRQATARSGNMTTATGPRSSAPPRAPPASPRWTVVASTRSTAAAGSTSITRMPPRTSSATPSFTQTSSGGQGSSARISACIMWAVVGGTLDETQLTPIFEVISYQDYGTVNQ